MPRRPLLLLAILVALTAFGSATAEGEAAGDVGQVSVLQNVTFSCSAAFPSTSGGCLLERPVLVFGAVELAVGLDFDVTDVNAVMTGGDWNALSLAPYGILAVYQDNWSAWAEVKLPELAGLPVLGKPDWLRLGFSYRFEEPP